MRNLPSYKRIVDYWLKNLPEHLDDGQIVMGQCFACGDSLKLERCHIVSKDSGGPDTVDNLHILCGACHLDSEYLSQSDYWKWYEISIKENFDMGFSRLFRKIKAIGAVNYQEHLNTIYR